MRNKKGKDMKKISKSVFFSLCKGSKLVGKECCDLCSVSGYESIIYTYACGNNKKICKIETYGLRASNNFLTTEYYIMGA